MDLRTFIQSLKAKAAFYIVVKESGKTLYSGYSDKIPEELLTRKTGDILTNCALEALVVYLAE